MMSTQQTTFLVGIADRRRLSSKTHASVRTKNLLTSLWGENRGRLRTRPGTSADLSNAMTPIIEEFFKRVDASKLPPRTKSVFDKIGGVVKVTVTGGPVFTTSRTKFGALGGSVP